MIPFTTCLRLNRKRHKEGRQQQSSGTATEELVAKPTTSLGEASKAEQEFDREVEESLEARRCAWRVMEQRMAEPGAKKIIPPAMTTTTKTTTIHTSHGKLARGAILLFFIFLFLTFYFAPLALHFYTYPTLRVPGRALFCLQYNCIRFHSSCLSYSRLRFRPMLCRSSLLTRTRSPDLYEQCHDDA